MEWGGKWNPWHTCRFFKFEKFQESKTHDILDSFLKFFEFENIVEYVMVLLKSRLLQNAIQ